MRSIFLLKHNRINRVRWSDPWLLLLFVAAAAHAQERAAAPEVDIVVDGDARSAIRLQRVDDTEIGISVDGRLDEPIWEALPVLGDYRVIEPDTLAEPSYSTRLRIFYTARGIYAAFELEQPRDTLVERHAPRDSFDVNRDTIGLNLDSSGSGRYGYWVTLALGDGQMDGTVLPERQYSREWDGVWHGATARTDFGWSAEFFVPWSQMAMPKEQGVRRVNLYSSRKVAHLNERWGWPALPSSQPRFMSLWQPLHLDGVDPRQQWSIFPYVSSTFDRVGDDHARRPGSA